MKEVSGIIVKQEFVRRTSSNRIDVSRQRHINAAAGESRPRKGIGNH